MPGFIYFLHAPSAALIKIGFAATDPDRRLRQIAMMSASPVEPLAIMPGDRDREREIHRRFMGLWSHGEWFRDAPELRDYIGHVAEPWVTGSRAGGRKPVDLRPARSLADWAETLTVTFEGQTRTVAEWTAIYPVSVASFCRHASLGNDLAGVVAKGKWKAWADEKAKTMFRKPSP